MDPAEVSISQTFLADHGIQQDEFDATKLEWDTLIEIAKDHVSSFNSLQSAANYISQRLQTVHEIHSLKVRIKNYRHLIAKVIRKKIDRPDLHIDSKNYRDLVTDLIGIRALHLFKDEWLPIHKFVLDIWDLHEQPKAYVRVGDPKQGFLDANCEVSEHPFGYRSIHYLLKSNPDKRNYIAELQVRTIFEEGWSEIDHCVRYPRHSDDAFLADFLGIFNRLAGSADEMGSFIKSLVDFTAAQAQKIAEVNTNALDMEAALKKTVSELKISQAERDKLNTMIADLRKSSQSTRDQSVLSTYGPTNPSFVSSPSSFIGGQSSPNSLNSFIGGQSSPNSLNSFIGGQSSPNSLNSFIGSQSPPNSLSSFIGSQSPPNSLSSLIGGQIGKIEKTCTKCHSRFIEEGSAVFALLGECPRCRGLSLGTTL